MAGARSRTGWVRRRRSGRVGWCLGALSGGVGRGAGSADCVRFWWPAVRSGGAVPIRGWCDGGQVRWGRPISSGVWTAVWGGAVARCSAPGEVDQSTAVVGGRPGSGGWDAEGSTRPRCRLLAWGAASLGDPSRWASRSAEAGRGWRRTGGTTAVGTARRWCVRAGDLTCAGPPPARSRSNVVGTGSTNGDRRPLPAVHRRRQAAIGVHGRLLPRFCWVDLGSVAVLCASLGSESGT